MPINSFERLGPGQYRSRYVALCRNCHGSGFVHDQDRLPTVCHTCDGTGKVHITKEINIIVKPFNISTP